MEIQLLYQYHHCGDVSSDMALVGVLNNATPMVMMLMMMVASTLMTETPVQNHTRTHAHPNDVVDCVMLFARLRS
jgi:hypothetical protein